MTARILLRTIGRQSIRSGFGGRLLALVFIVSGVSGLVRPRDSAAPAPPRNSSAGGRIDFNGAYYSTGSGRDPIPAQHALGRRQDGQPLFRGDERATGGYDDPEELVDQEIDLVAAGGLDASFFDDDQAIRLAAAGFGAAGARPSASEVR